MIINIKIASVCLLLVFLIFGSSTAYVQDEKSGSELARAAFISAPDDVFWDNRFAQPGADRPIEVITAAGRDVYVGAGFSNVDDVLARPIIKWDGISWTPLGSGISGFIRSIAVSGQSVYAGGSGIQRWDGHNWSELGAGVQGSVNAIAFLGDDLYAAGIFPTAGGQTVNNIARWDGSNWHPLGSGVSGTVRALAVLGNDLYVGGSFEQAGGLTVNRIAKWDGSNWSALAGGFSNCQTCEVTSIAVSGNDLFVGGVFR